MTTILRLLLVIVLIALCIGLVGGIWSYDRIPDLAADKFGPPSPGLNAWQQVMYSIRLLNREQSLVMPRDPAGQPQPFAINMGESVGSIATRLEDEGLIADSESFRLYLVYAGLDTRVQAGQFQLSPAMSTLEIAGELLDPVPEEVTFNILPGWRAEEIANVLPTSGLRVSADDFLKMVREPPDEIFPRDVPAGTPLEGFLLPGSYQINRGVNARELVQTFTARFDEAVTQDVRDGIAAQGLSLVDAVKLASIVEREAVVDEEQRLIASVFYNRLAIGMKLDSDPTVQYAIGYQLGSGSWWKSPLAVSDLQVNSSYNTYIYPGLPPGPISNPGLGALQAVANPEQSGYYYFRARCDGSGLHSFAVTYEEHLQNGCP